MKTPSSHVLTVLILSFFSIPWIASAQSNSTADIFADLSSFEPAPASTPAAAPPPAETPAIAMSTAPVPAPVTLQPPVQESPVLYTADNGGATAAPAVQPQAPEEPIDVEDCISRGKAAFADDDLAGAQKFFEAVLYQDPYNATAIRWIHRIADKKASRETKSYETTRTRMLENVQAAWNTPKSEGEKPDSSSAQPELSEADKQAAALRSRLENILIPAISFQDADIQQVVLELSALCRKLDPEHKGANLVVFGTAGTALPSITFSGTDLSAIETLDIITQIAGMKYEIGPNMVSLMPVNYEPPQQMVSTEFDIMPSVGSKMAARTGGQPTGLMDVREFFSTVPFPPGTSAQYNPEFNVLLVRNVPKHIDEIKSLLDRYNRKAKEERSQQVEIETKFIEVSQGALDELGFKWTLGAGQTYVNNDKWALKGDAHLFTDTLRSGETAFDSGVSTAGRATSFNSYAGAVADPTGTGLIGQAGEMTIKKITGTPVELLIKALERSAGSDLLSAPKILTKSGETASIHVGEEHWYPTAFDVSIERYSQPSLIPLDYQEEKTGVMLEVTPELDPENGTINMKLAPEIRELAGYDEQHVGTLWPFFSSGGSSANAFSISATLTNVTDLLKVMNPPGGATITTADRLIARRPIFKTRKVNTTVTIEDGSTIAMGGLIKEQLETFKDSVPILGHIPIIGRLFRSEGQRSVKRNLLIFVTANQVDATGYKKAAQ
jgi:general secretion pathway protein D